MDRLIDYMGHHPLLVATVVVAALIVGAYEYYLRMQGRSAISPQELIRLMNQGALILDVRSLDEYATGHISGARQLTAEQLHQGRRDAEEASREAGTWSTAPMRPAVRWWCATLPRRDSPRRSACVGAFSCWRAEQRCRSPRS